MTAQSNGHRVRQSSPSTCWGDRSAALAAEAACLAEQLAPQPGTDEGYTPAVAAWLDEYRAMSDVVGELAGWDIELLRHAAGPTLDVGRRPLGDSLLINAAIVAEQRARPVVDQARHAARLALSEAGAPMGGVNWSSYTTEALEVAVGMLELAERRMAHRRTVDRAGAEKLLAAVIAGRREGTS